MNNMIRAVLALAIFLFAHHPIYAGVEPGLYRSTDGFNPVLADIVPPPKEAVRSSAYLTFLTSSPVQNQGRPAVLLMIAQSHVRVMPKMPLIHGDLELTGAFTRAMAPNAKTGGGFVTITNIGKRDDRLISAQSPVAGIVQLHKMSMQDDVMVMREQKDGIPIPAGKTVMLKPGGLHIMFMQVLTPFVENDIVPVTLQFEQAGDVQILLEVGGLSARGPRHTEH